MTRKSPRRRSLRLKTRTPQIGSKDTEADDDVGKAPEEEGFVSRQELLNRE
jgi:hypothetical protein